MRHKKKGTHLGRTTSHKKALMRNMVASLFEHKSIKTTHAKAKEARRYAEKLITYAKKGALHHRRLAFKFLQNKEAVKTLFDEIAPACTDRPGGYTRIVKLGFRQGDAAAISLLELIDLVSTPGSVEPKAKEKAKVKKEKTVEAKAEKETAEKETGEKEAEVAS